MLPLERMTAADVLLAIALGALVVLGYNRGIPRRLISIGATLLALALTLQLRTPVGAYLGSEWTGTPRAYGYMVAFSVLFTLALAAIAWFVEWRMPEYVFFKRWPVVEGVIAGALALVQGLILLAAAALMLDPYFTGDGLGAHAVNEFGPYRTASTLFDRSLVMGFVRSDVVPVLLAPFRGGLTADIEHAFPAAPRATGGPEATPAPTLGPSEAPTPAPSAG